ncbi:MAG: hypothetical protein AAF802_05455 [Planctomycetota bacterium]
MGFLPNRLGRAFVTPVASAAFAACLLLTPATAQERLAASEGASLTDGTKPVAVVTIGSINKMMADVNYITGLVGQPQFGGMFSMMAGVYANGMDMDEPIGVLVPMVNGMPEPIAVLPTSDVKAVLKRLEAQTGPVDELDDGTLVVTVGANTVYIRQSGEKAIAARVPEVLELVPASTSGLFAGMGNKYNVAIRLSIQQIPLEIRNVLIDQMRQGFEQAMSQQPDGEATRDLAENSIAQLETLINDADEVNFGFTIDQSAQNFGFDFSFTALAGTDMAAIYASQESIPSQFSAVIQDGAAMYLHSATSVGPDAIDQAREGIDMSLGMVTNAMASEGNIPEATLSKIEQYMSRFGKIIGDSISEGKTDSGMIAKAGPNEFKMVFGTFVADGAEVAQLAKDLAKEVPDDPRAPKFSFDIGDYEGVTMHMVEVDVPASEEEVRAIFGEAIQVHIGTGPKAIYLAVGKGSKEAMQALIRSAGKDTNSDRPLSQMKVEILPILELAQSVKASDELATIISALQGSGQKGTITIVGESIPNGSSGKIRMGEGLLRAVGAGVMAQQQANQPF